MCGFHAARDHRLRHRRRIRRIRAPAGLSAPPASTGAFHQSGRPGRTDGRERPRLASGGPRAPRQRGLVVGTGNIGLLAILVARAKGARQIIAVGKYPPRQDLARAYGAQLVLEPDDARLQDLILERTEGLGAALVLEAAGTPSSLRTAVAAARKGGKIVVLGVFQEEVALDYRTILLHEKQIIGSLIYQRADFADAMRLLARGEVDTRRHITGEIPLDTIVSGGFVPLVEKKADHIKLHVLPEEGGS